MISEAIFTTEDGKERRVLPTNDTEIEVIEEMKPEVCCVAGDYQEQKEDNQTDAFISHYTLPDGTVVILDEECYEAPEVLFNPLLAGSATTGLSDLIFEVIMDCPIETRRAMFGNIILIGGTCDMKGFPERLKHDLELLVPDSVTVNLLLPDQPHTCTFLGASQFANMPTFVDTMLSRQQYKECGVSYLHNKFYYADDYIPLPKDIS